MSLHIIVLAAGEGYQLDGFNKALMRHPGTGESVIEQYERLFETMPITVVVGYRALTVMHRYPHLEYVHNTDWRLSGNAYSLGLALDDRPSLVLSADLFFDERVVARLLEGAPDGVAAAHRPNRTMNAMNLDIGDDGVITDVYQGAVRSDRHPEAPGIFKISTPSLLRQWKKRCLEHRHLFALQNLPLDTEIPVHAIDIDGCALDEVNTPGDYIQLMSKTRTS